MTKEQAIEILEKLLYAYSFIDYRFNNMLEVDETNAIQYILSDYERILKENKKKDKQIEQYQNILATNDMLHIKESQEKDKVIDLMLDEITNNIINTCPFEDYNYDLDCENKCNDDYKECWKQYFENRAKELLNK